MLLPTHPSLQEYLMVDPNWVPSPIISILPFMSSGGDSHDLPMGRKQNLGTGCRIFWTSLSIWRPSLAVAYWNIFVVPQILPHVGISQDCLKISHLLNTSFKKIFPPGLCLIPILCLLEKCKLYLLARCLLCDSTSVKVSESRLLFIPALFFPFLSHSSVSVVKMADL